MTTILLVDDNADIRFLAKTVLSSAGFEVREAGGGRSALAHLAEADLPDIVLLDVQMPDMDGWTTLKAIRANPHTAEVPVVFWTVKGRPEHQLEGWKLGCDGYVAKPFSTHELEEEVRIVVSRDEEERERVRLRAIEAVRERLPD